MITLNTLRNNRWMISSKMRVTRPSLLKFSIWVALFTAIIPYPFPFALGQATVMSSDVASVFLYLYLFFGLLKSNVTYKFSRTTITFFTLLGCWLLWISFTYIILPDRMGLSLVARIFKKSWIFLPYAIIGYRIGWGSFNIRKYFITTLLVFTSIISVIAIVQCVSGGQLLSGHYTNQRFLGFLTPLPEARYDYRNLGTLTLEDTKALRTAGADSEFVTSFLFRAHGPFEESNLLTAFTVPIVCLILGMLVKRPKFQRRQRLTIYFLITLLGMIVSFGITGYGALIVVCLYLFGISPIFFVRWLTKPIILLLVFVTIMAAGIILVPALFNSQKVVDSRLIRIIRPLESDALNGRVRLINAAIAEIQSSPWVGTRSIQQEEDIAKQETMTIYINMAETSGVVAQLLFLAILIKFLRASWHVYHKGVESEDRSIGLGVHLFFISLLILEFFYNWIVFEGIAYISFMLGAMCVAMSAQARAKSRTISLLNQNSF